MDLKIDEKSLEALIKGQITAAAAVALFESTYLVSELVRYAVNAKQNSYDRETIFETTVHKMIREEAQAAVRAHCAQLERDLDDANTTIAALRDACAWKGFSMSAEATADKLRDEGYRAVPDYIERIQTALRLVTPRVHPDGVAVLEKMAAESEDMKRRLEAVREKYALDTTTSPDAFGVRVEERQPSEFARRVQAGMREAAVGEVGCHLARIQRQLDRHATVLRALAEHVDTDNAHDVRRAVNALEAP